MKRILFFSVPLLVAFNLFAKEFYIDSGPNAQERLQEALILIEEGDTLIIKVSPSSIRINASWSLSWALGPGSI